ncbi:MAG TPA: alpha/beta fold hydrolase, partial [Solirubrobacterales bacterium]|nr:alpha/beta fold hydrolase [Solirubrobacterales bacterium]
MVLKTRSWGKANGSAVVCLHGLVQHGGIFAPLGERLASCGHRVLAVDLRGHGESGRQPPWNVDTHLDDLFETLGANGVERASWVGHSFGGRLVAEAAARCPERVERLVLLDPGLQVPLDRAMRGAEIDRLDWSFATVEGALNALLSNESIVAAPREVVADYVREDVHKGPDGRFRFSHSPAAAVVAWSEMAMPMSAIARVHTLAVLAEVPLYDSSVQIARYEEELGDLLAVV